MAFIKGWIQKEAPCVSVTRVNAKKPHALNFYLRMAKKSTLTITSSEIDRDQTTVSRGQWWPSQNREKLTEFCWEIITHPSYNQHLTPSDYYLKSVYGEWFCWFLLKNFALREACKNRLLQVFVNREDWFCEITLKMATGFRKKGAYLNSIESFLLC